MEHITFLESAAQSIALRDENIPPPVSINVEDLMEPQILSQRKRQAEEYLIDVKYKNSRFISASLDDVSEAEQYLFGTKLAMTMMKVSAAVPALQNEVMSARLEVLTESTRSMQTSIVAMQTSIVAMQTTMVAMQTTMVAMQTTMVAMQTSVEMRLTAIERRITNSSSHELDDVVTPPPFYGKEDPPLNFPPTVGAVMALTPGDLLTRIENYYNLQHTGSIKARISRVRKAYCIGLTVLA